jgi:hypothetical protein
MQVRVYCASLSIWRCRSVMSGMSYVVFLRSRPPARSVVVITAFWRSIDDSTLSRSMLPGGCARTGPWAVVALCGNWQPKAQPGSGNTKCWPVLCG